MMQTEGDVEGGVSVERRDAVSTITVNRPRRMNALTYQAMVRLAECVEAEAQRPEVRALVLTGAGGSFSAGADLSSPDDQSVTPEDGVRAANRVVTAILSAPVPVVARVPGPAVGVGVPISLAADLVVASQDAYFLLAFTKVGLMPDGGASLLVTASIGRARAMAMVMRAQRVPASAAVAMGLIDRVVPADELDAVVSASVAHFVRGPRQAFVLAKRAINAAALDLLSATMEREVEGQSTLLRSNDFLEGAKAMLAKRPPQFSD
jgi:enoyl-CoA hydratase/carnithine racemase